MLLTTKILLHLIWNRNKTYGRTNSVKHNNIWISFSVVRSSAGGLLDGGHFGEERAKAGCTLVISARMEDDLASPDRNKESNSTTYQTNRPEVPILKEGPAAVSFQAGRHCLISETSKIWVWFGRVHLSPAMVGLGIELKAARFFIYFVAFERPRPTVFIFCVIFIFICVSCISWSWFLILDCISSLF